jgi:hypothetical protein
MGRKLKVYLPPYMRWVVAAFLAIAWGLITYQTFCTDQGRQEIGIVGWALITGLLLGVGGLIWAMASGRLPAYIIEEEDDRK